MLERIKGVMTVRDEMDGLKAEIAELRSHLVKLSADYELEIKRVRELHDTQSDLLATFLQSTQTLNRLKDEIRKELEEFRMINRQTQSKIQDKIDQEVRAMLTANTKAIELDKVQYEKIRDEIHKNGQLLTGLNNEVLKLIAVSTQIKSQDFALTDYHKKLLEEDRNKVQLLARIDELEHMIGKMKQGRYNQ